MSHIIKKIISSIKSILRPFKYIVYSKKHHVKRKKVDVKQINCLFIVQRTECFTSVQSLCDEISKDKRFKMTFLVLPKYKQFTLDSEQFDLNSIVDTVDFIKKSYYKNEIIAAYDFIKKTYIKLDIDYDYIFINIPYSEQYPRELNLEYFNQCGRLCYLPYGYNSTDNHELFNITNPWDSLSLLYRYYAINKINYNMLFRHRYLFLSNFTKNKTLKHLGYPRFDLIEESISNDVRCLLWLPRYETDLDIGHEKSSFLKYKDYILEFAKNNPKIEIIIRPHPLTFSNHINKGLLTIEDINRYREKIDSINNVFLDEKQSYVESVSKADLILSDFTGLLVEIFLMGKKVAFFGEKRHFSKKFWSMIDSFYDGNTWENFLYCYDCLKDGNDIKKEVRKKAVDDFWRFNKNNAAKNIIKDLLGG